MNELLTLLAHGHAAILQRLREERQRAADAMFFERAGHLHTVLAALDEATVGRPLALLPVAWRNIVVIFAGPLPPTQEMFCVRHGLFAGRFVLEGKPAQRQELETFLTRCYATADHASYAGEAVVDELRIVAGWLHRTRTRARWVHVDPWMSPTATVEAVARAMP